MTMFPRRARLKPGEGGPTIHKPKRIKTHHTAEDQVIREFQDILGHLRQGDIGGQPILEYDGGVEADRHTPPYLADPPEDILPEANLRNVPHDPSLQALWIAREIKRLAVFNDNHMHQYRAASVSTTSPVSPIFGTSTPDLAHGEHDGTLRSSLKSSRSSGRKRRQTNKAKDLHLVELDVDDEPLKLTNVNGNPDDGLAMLSALVTNQRINNSLLHSLNLGPGNFQKRHVFGIQFLQSMAADTTPPDPAPAAKLKHSLWRSRNSVPIIAALHILAGFDDVVQAIDVAFQGRLEYSTPLTKREFSINGFVQPNDRGQSSSDTVLNGHISAANPISEMRSKRNSTSRVKLIHRKPKDATLPMPFMPELVPRPDPKAAIGSDMLFRSEDGPSFETTRPEVEHDDSVAPKPTGPKQFSAIDSRQSARAIVALKGATAILDDMAYGALKSFFIPQQSGPLNNQYLTPYGTPAPNTYVTPYADPPRGQQRHVNEQTTLPQTISGPQMSNFSAIGSITSREAGSAFHRGSLNKQVRGQQITGVTKGKGKGKEKPKEYLTRPDDVLESTETEKDTLPVTKLTPITPSQNDQDDEEDFTQIDSFLALAAGDDSDSDDDIDRDRTISRELTPAAAPPGDTAVDSIVQGIIGELVTNQNLGHGIGFLTPQTHLYHLSNAQHFAEGLRRHVNDARLEVNCVVSAEHSRALQAFYNALIKRITNPYLDGTLPPYSNVVYHNGRAYQAIPGPGHPAFQQQPPYPLPPPPSSQMIPSHTGPLPMTMPIDTTQRSLSLQPNFRRENSGMIQGFGFTPGFHPSVLQTGPLPNPPRPNPQDFPLDNLRNPPGLPSYESSVGNYLPIIFQKTSKRKRRSK